MPHSPFTRLLGLAIVAGYFAVLLWPGDNTYLRGWQAVIALPIVIGLFSWSAVRNAPPFDDRAFHRTLPPGEGFAFRRVLMIHGLVLAGIALAVVVYCRVFNFGWQVTSYGILALTMPVWALMGASGIAASLSSSRQWGRSWGYIAIFVIPVFSATLLYWVHHYFDPEVKGYFYLSSHRTMAVAGAILYSLIWWLVAVRRRCALGSSLGAATGAMMPWIFIYGGFVEAQGRGGVEQVEKSHVVLSRKSPIPTEGKWLPVEKLLNVEGLREGEFVRSWGFKVNDRFLEIWEVPDDPAQAEKGVYGAEIFAGRFEGENLSWGEKAVWNHLSKRVPGHETFGFWNGKMEHQKHVAVLRPGESVTFNLPRGKFQVKPDVYRSKLTQADMVSAPWKQIYAGVFRMEKVGEFDIAAGGTCRLPEGGVIRVSARHQDDDEILISFRHYFQRLEWEEGPWFDTGDRYWGQQPWVIAVDESRKHAYALSQSWSTNVRNERVMLGEVYESLFSAGFAKTRDGAARIEMLRRCSLHIFWPTLVSQLREEIPPPP